MAAKQAKKKKNPDDFASVAARLECDPDLNKVDEKLRKIADGGSAGHLPQRSNAVSGQEGRTPETPPGKIAKAKLTKKGGAEIK